MKIKSITMLLFASIFFYCANNQKERKEENNNNVTEFNENEFDNTVADQRIDIDNSTSDTCSIYWRDFNSYFDMEYEGSLFASLSKSYSPSVSLRKNLYSELPDSLFVFKLDGAEYTFLKVTHLNKIIIDYLKIDSITSSNKDIISIGEEMIAQTEFDRDNCEVVFLIPDGDMAYLCLDMKDDKIDKFLYVNLIN